MFSRCKVVEQQVDHSRNWVSSEVSIITRCRLVGARSLDMTGLLALVADSLGSGFLRAFAGFMADFAAWKKVSRRMKPF